MESHIIVMTVLQRKENLSHLWQLVVLTKWSEEVSTSASGKLAMNGRGFLSLQQATS